MEIKLLVPRATATGPENAGDVIEVSAETAERMVAAGQAEYIRQAKREKAVRRPRSEKAADV